MAHPTPPVLLSGFATGALLALLGLAAGCPADAPKSKPAAPPPGRFESVAPAAVKKDAVDAFCDTHDDPDTATTFTWPKLDGAAPTGAGWTWVNAWATWCGPCVGEMPMLERWKDKLAKEGVEFTLTFLSLDANAADVKQYAAAHPDITMGPRIADFSLLASWLTSNGLNSNASIPLQFFVDGKQKIRCTRMGAISETDYDTVKQILSK